jgi:hypothetical protein
MKVTLGMIEALFGRLGAATNLAFWTDLPS